MIYNESSVQRVYKMNAREAKKQLMQLPVYSGPAYYGYEPEVPGLIGWVFEQTIQHCIRRELEKMSLSAEIEEQVNITESVKIALQIGKIAIEIKPNVLSSQDDIDKCKNDQAQANQRGWRYILLSSGEATFRTGIIEALGKDNVILLENYDDGEWKPNEGEWTRFIGIIVDSLDEKT
jgi:hypothetical protein